MLRRRLHGVLATLRWRIACGGPQLCLSTRLATTSSEAVSAVVDVAASRPTGGQDTNLVSFPARQSPFDPALLLDNSKTLLARAHYCLFTLAADVDADSYALFCATNNKLFVMGREHLWKGARWADEQVGESYLAGFIFASDAAADLKAAVQTLLQKAQKQLIEAPDVWGITYLAFRAQREVVKGVELPTSLEHAAFLLSHKQFDAALVDPSVFDAAAGAYRTDGELLRHAGAARDAVLDWSVLLDVHRRFGTPGSRKTLTPVEQIVRRVMKAVNIFVVDIDVRVGKGTIEKGYTMIVTIYDAQRRSQSVHSIRSLAEETQKLNALTTLLYGEGSSSISLFVPTARTKPPQLVAFARTCRPKSPFFVAELSGLGAHFGGRAIAKDATTENDPRTLWTILRGNCAGTEKTQRKDEDRLDHILQRGFTTLANRLFAERLRKVSPAIRSAVSSIPAQEDARAAHTRVTQLAAKALAQPVPSVASATFLNKVNVNDAEVVFGLQQWRAKIYESEERLARERMTAEGLRRYLVLDLETTTVQRYKRIANPFTRENFVVLSGARDYHGTVFMGRRYFERGVALRYDDLAVTASTDLVEGSSKQSLFLPALDDYDVIVGHNIKFDLLHIWRDAELRRFLARGGKIWDTMYAEYLLSGQEVKLGCGAGLEDVARSYGGQTPKLDAVKRAWAEGKETYTIPYSILSEYLHGDLENTELIFRKQLERALQQRQVIICAARMDGLLCTTEMEYNGLKTNVELAQTQTNELMTKVTELHRQLEDAIPGEIPPDCRKFFNWSSNQHLIHLFFGGTLKLETNARESKPLPGECFARHLLFVNPTAYPATQFSNGVFLRPPIHVLGIGDYAVMTGMATKKGTRVFKAYFNAYMRQANFRKSSTITDSLRREMVAIPRAHPDQRGATSALANLLPRRHLFLFAAIAPATQGGIAKLFVKNPITGEAVTIAGDAPKASELAAFIETQVRAHTDMLVPSDEDSATSMDNAAFVEAQVTIFARDACFSFQRLLNSDTSLADYFSAHSGYMAASGLEPERRYSIAFADTIATLAYYRHEYVLRRAAGGDGGGSSGSSNSSSARLKNKRGTAAGALAAAIAGAAGGAGMATADLEVIPAKAMPRAGKTKLANAQSFRKQLLQEANMRPEEWCNHYIDVFLHIANAALQHDALAPDTKPRKKAKTAPRAISSAVKRNGGHNDDGDIEGDTAVGETGQDELPVLLRQRRAFVGYYNSLPDAERKRLSLMCLVGRTISSIYDCFAVPCAHDDKVEVAIKGRLAAYIPSELEREQVMRRFRSVNTRQLQVGEDTLQYFVSTHNDQTAKTILELRALEKLIGTYYESTDGGSGMVSLVHPIDSCIHHELIHNKTNTGRLASANPNCQNIPTGGKSNLRDMFISRYGEKGMCIEADYSQLEVVALAVLARDEQMLDDLRHSVDFHCKRVTMMRPDLKYTEVLQRAKRNKEPEFVKLRQQAKIFSFQRQYGAGVKMISKSTGLTQDQVRMLIEKERETYRGVDVFNNMVTLSANSYDASLQNGAKNVRGHQFFKGMFPVLTGSRYVFTESDIPEDFLRNRYSARKSTNFSPTHLKNYPVQGFAGEIVQVMLGVLWRHFLRVQNYNGLAVLTNTVHDCVWVDCHESVYRNVAKDVESIMTSVRTVLNNLYPEMNVTVDFPCDVVAGENMGALRPIAEETLV